MKEYFNRIYADIFEVLGEEQVNIIHQYYKG